MAKTIASICPTNEGKAKYLSLRDSVIIFKDSHTSNFISGSVFPEKKILDLLALNN
jgi:hypothetical protein